MIRGALASGPLDRLILHVARLLDSNGRESTAGMRNLLGDDETLTTFASKGAASLMSRDALAADAIPVRMILFNKSDHANWSVPWHQDVNIAVVGRIEDEGYGPWSTKKGVPHVVPPHEILQSMITLRIHLDDCDETNGALRVVPGSHANGIISEGSFEPNAMDARSISCNAKRGDVLIMRPLLFHASRKATARRMRRILHIEYASATLPDGLDWFFRCDRKHHPQSCHLNG